jgi:hypothetical protein
MAFSSQPFRASRFQKGAKYPGLLRLFLVMLVLTGCLARGSLAQPGEGRYLTLGPAAVPGVAVQIGAVEAGRMFTRDFSVAVGYRRSRQGSVRASMTFGGAIRIFGIQRTIFNASFRSVDLDAGLRLGPAVLFRFEESEIERNRRFTLIADPFIRFVARKQALFFVELGIHRPAIRGGLWLRL